MVDLDPTVLRCAKQIYYNLKLTHKIKLLSNANGEHPIEVQKMQQLTLLFDSNKLEVIVKKFLQNPNPRKTLDDFLSQIEIELKSFSLSDDDFDNFDGFDDLTDQDLCALDVPGFKKREREPSPFEDSSIATKRMKPEPKVKPTPVTKANPNLPTKSLACFSIDVKNSYNYNNICNPSGSPKLFDKVPWIVLYEIARFVQCFNIPWNQLPFDAFQTFLTVASGDPVKLHDAMITWNQEARLGLKVNGLSFTKMERCPESVWSHLKKNLDLSDFSSWFDSPNILKGPSETLKKNTVIHRMIHFNGIVDFDGENSCPKVILRAPKLEASNRLFRKFGQDRFLELKLVKSAAAMIRANTHFFLKPFLFMQRTFKFLFIKDDTIILFATEGNGIRPISIQQVIEWHMPILENWSMSMSKYASRMSLGYSSSIPTLLFSPEEIIYIDDIYSDSGSLDNVEACMTDGCGIISCSAMRRIMGCQATDELPCAIQGRIAGAKGIWIISPDLDFTSGNYIKIRKSQNKFKTGLPQSDTSLDPHHYTFDLVKNSVCVYPSNLNTQFIQCLSAGGVPTSVFVDILKDYIHRMSAVITENQSVKILRDWVAKAGSIMKGRWEAEANTYKGLWCDVELNEDLLIDDETDSGVFTMDSDDQEQPTKRPDTNVSYNSENATIENQNSSSYFRLNKYSGQPYNLHETIVRLLDAGFDLSSPYVAERITMVFRQIMQSITIKYKIEVLESCTVTCVPDPTGTLEEGEVFLHLSSRRIDEKTGIRVGQILGDVIVTRNPCGLRSDVQKVKAVDCPALRMYTDLIVFSIKSKASLASQLSGGDYDGDMVFCCWDKRIVDPFTSSPVLSEPIEVREAFEKQTSSVGCELGQCNDTERAIQRNFISVPIADGTLGTYENWRTVLAEKTSLDDPQVRYLAHMCAKLVDAPKQGLRLKNVAKERDRNTFSDMVCPPWFMDKKDKQRKTGLYLLNDINSGYVSEGNDCVTTMDFLYDTLLKETAAFTKYSNTLYCDPDNITKDNDLMDPWNRGLELAIQTNDTKLKADLDLIKNHIEQNLNEYRSQCSEYISRRHRSIKNISRQRRNQNSLEPVHNQFNSYFELEEFFAKEFLNFPLNKDLKSSIFIFDIEANGGKNLQNIKASYAYIISVASHKPSKYCYVVAYDVLRRIKADACAKKTKENGLSDPVSVSMYKSMVVDRAWIRKIRESNYLQSQSVKTTTNSNDGFFGDKTFQKSSV